VYLSDKDIRDRLHDLQIECLVPERPFEPKSQIQPCSIDLRLGSVFWSAQKSYAIDLRAKTPPAIENKLWKRVVLSSNETLRIKPKQYISTHL
jgi:deoxycytidine triphosphate deaminase